MKKSTKKAVKKAVKKVAKKVSKKVGKKADKTKTADPAFGAPTLLPGENEIAYAKLLQGVIEDVQPKGMIEKIWVQDLVRLTWEVRQYQMFRVQALNKMHFNYEMNPNLEFSVYVETQWCR